MFYVFIGVVVPLYKYMSKIMLDLSISPYVNYTSIKKI